MTETRERPETFSPRRMLYRQRLTLRVIEILRFYCVLEVVTPGEFFGQRAQADRERFAIWRADMHDLVKIGIGTELVIEGDHHRIHNNLIVPRIVEWKHRG